MPRQSTRKSQHLTAGVPRYELDPSARLISCLRQAVPGFQPNDRWWIEVEGKIKDAHWMSHPEKHDQFCRDFKLLSGDQLIQHLQREGLIPAPPVDEYQRLADELSPAARKVLAALDELGAGSLADRITRNQIVERTAVSFNVLRRVMEKEFPYVEPLLVKTKTGTEGGCWLTPEGRVVSATIDKKILPAMTPSPQRAGNGRARRA